MRIEHLIWAKHYLILTRIQRDEFHFFAILLTSLKKLKALVQGHKASKCQSGDSNPGPAVFIVQMLYLSTTTRV